MNEGDRRDDHAAGYGHPVGGGEAFARTENQHDRNGRDGEGGVHHRQIDLAGLIRICVLHLQAGKIAELDRLARE